jgi:hypothetical protein
VRLSAVARNRIVGASRAGVACPRWLTGRKDLDQVAQRRTLLILSVLSGHAPVTTAIVEHGISRSLYYQLEMKATLGMMRALVPAQYYGQHERQNAEHRDWCERECAITQHELDRMKSTLNELWRRPTLGWRSAGPPCPRR